MLAHGFSIDVMVELVRAALATATAERVVAGKREIEVARVRITAAGRKALAERGKTEAAVKKLQQQGRDHGRIRRSIDVARSSRAGG
jgi:hypothetical protein